MKQIAFISGKGGTGKSTMVATLVQLVENKRYADCDVDEPNLRLLTENNQTAPVDYYGSTIADIDSDLCIHCDRCREVCRFDAITEDHQIRKLACEGCAACTVVCPVEAISLRSLVTGITDRQDTKYGIFADAALSTGADGSGKLVTEVRKRVTDRDAAQDWLLIDGSPGIGCVVIASITGVDAIVAVAEPTRSGRHDLLRVLDVADHFGIPAYVCINKSDLDELITRSLEQTCKARNVPILAKIPFDPAVMLALQKSQTPLEAGVESYYKPLMELWQKLQKELNNNENRK